MKKRGGGYTTEMDCCEEQTILFLSDLFLTFYKILYQNFFKISNKRCAEDVSGIVRQLPAHKMLDKKCVI